MENKIAVVTGGLSGIGKAICEVLEAQNYKVYILSRSNLEKKNNVIVCDVSKSEQVKKAFEELKAQVNKIDVLVNSAGFGGIGALELCEEELIRKMYDTNVFGTIFVIQQALPLMNRGSKIFNISSMQSLAPVPFKSIYSSSKAAVTNLTYALRIELAEAGISVCCMCPGDIKTNFTKNRIGEIKTKERYGDKIEKCVNWQDNREDKRSDVKVVKKAFLKQLKRKNCKPLVIMPFKYKIINLYSRLVSTKTYLKSIKKMFIKK